MMSILSPLEPLWRRLAYQNKGPLRVGAPVLLPASWIYGCTARLRRFLHQYGLLKSKSFDIPILSVGNLTVGGVGKTPFSLYVAQRLKRMGFSPAILLRGYGRTSGDPLIVSHNSFIKPQVQTYGDEPALLAFLSDFPIGICSKRTQGVEHVIQETGCDLVILDDGFQHVQLKRDIDLVILDSNRPFGNGHCLPHGPLREPISSLRKASGLIINGDLHRRYYETVQKYNSSIYSGGMEWTGIYPLASWMNQDGGTPYPLEKYQGQQFLLVSGIGSPMRLRKQAQSLGFIIKGHLQYPDHHWFTEHDMRVFTLKSRALPLLLTEKDAIRFFALKDIPNELLNRAFVIHAVWKMNYPERFDRWLDTQLKLIQSPQEPQPVDPIPIPE